MGNPRTSETDDGTVNVSLHPESLTIVDEATRERWVAETAEDPGTFEPGEFDTEE